MTNTSSPGLNCGDAAFDDLAGAVDAGDVRKRTNNARVPLRGKGIFVV